MLIGWEKREDGDQMRMKKKVPGTLVEERLSLEGSLRWNCKWEKEGRRRYKIIDSIKGGYFRLK